MISPIGVMLCALATLVTVPVVLATGASSDGDEIAAVVVPETVTASELEADVDMEQLFDAGAKLDEVPEIPVEGSEPSASQLVLADLQSLVDGALGAARTEADVVETPASATDSTTTSPNSAISQDATSQDQAAESPSAQPANSAAGVAPPTTAAPTTAAPTTAAPTTAAPTTAVAVEPTTEVPAPTESAITESPQAAEQPQAAPSSPTAEQWAALRNCESSGNYTVVSSNGLYHGAYQFNQRTWDGLARQAGRSDLVGVPPSQAAAADQDALASLLWQHRGSQPWPHCGQFLPAGS